MILRVVDLAFLVASLWVICFAVIGGRVVIAMSHTLRANWIFRMTETRGVGEYLAAGRRSLLVIALAPVRLLLAVLFVFRWPTWPVAGHLVVRSHSRARICVRHGHSRRGTDNHDSNHS